MNEISLIEATREDIPKLISFENNACNEKTYSAMLIEQD
jgi:hypothetical protein